MKRPREGGPKKFRAGRSWGRATEREEPRYIRDFFWCPSAGRFVAVELSQVGPPLFPREIEILSCSAFDHPSRISCPRYCLDPFYRHEVWDEDSAYD